MGMGPGRGFAPQQPQKSYIPQQLTRRQQFVPPVIPATAEAGYDERFGNLMANPFASQPVNTPESFNDFVTAPPTPVSPAVRMPLPSRSFVTRSSAVRGTPNVVKKANGGITSLAGKK